MLKYSMHKRVNFSLTSKSQFVTGDDREGIESEWRIGSSRYLEANQNQDICSNEILQWAIAA